MLEFSAFEKKIRIVINEEGRRQVEIDGEIFPLFTDPQDIVVTEHTCGPYWGGEGDPKVVATVVNIPIKVEGPIEVMDGVAGVRFNPPFHLSLDREEVDDGA